MLYTKQEINVHKVRISHLNPKSSFELFSDVTCLFPNVPGVPHPVPICFNTVELFLI